MDVGTIYTKVPLAPFLLFQYTIPTPFKVHLTFVPVIMSDDVRDDNHEMMTINASGKYENKRPPTTA
jgi:hypothetical protein